MGNRFSKRNRTLVIIIATVTLVAILTTVLLCANYIPYGKKLKEGVILQYGEVPTYNWSPEEDFNINDYPSITIDGDLKILYLTDTHFTENTSYATNIYSKTQNNAAYKHVDKLITDANPNFIAIAGDVLTDPMSDLVIEQLGSFLNSYNIPWTMVFGNHDAEWRADKAKLSNILTSFDNCFFSPGPTNLQGLGNHVVNFIDNNGSLFYSFIGLDSGDWQQLLDTKVNFSNIILDKSERAFSTKGVGITDEQAEWYKWVVEGLNRSNNGVTVNTAVTFHIPLKAQRYANRLGTMTYNHTYGSIDDGDYYVTPEQFQTEDSDTNDKFLAAYNDYKANYKFYNYITSMGSTKDILTGHNHSGGYSAKYDGISFTSIAKTDHIYVNKSWDGGNRGGTIFVIGSDGIVKSNSAKHL